MYSNTEILSMEAGDGWLPPPPAWRLRRLAPTITSGGWGRLAPTSTSVEAKKAGSHHHQWRLGTAGSHLHHLEAEDDGGGLPPVHGGGLPPPPSPVEAEDGSPLHRHQWRLRTMEGGSPRFTVEGSPLHRHQWRLRTAPPLHRHQWSLPPTSAARTRVLLILWCEFNLTTTSHAIRTKFISNLVAF
ncbi:unnamed protein product [Arctogadus glacialis]